MTKIDILNASISIISLEGFEKLTLSTLADKLGVKLTALLLGNNVSNLAEKLAAHGADEVLVAEDKNLEHYTTDAYTKVICDLATEPLGLS